MIDLPVRCSSCRARKRRAARLRADHAGCTDSGAAGLAQGEPLALRLGRVQVVETRATSGPKLVINFPTKNHWRGVSRLDDIRTGVADLFAQVRERRIQSLAIPALGCGLGGLEWSAVRAVIEKGLVPLDAGMRVVLFGPQVTTSS